MSFDKCGICGIDAFMRCKEHNRCDKCGLKKEDITKENSLVHRENGLICDKCFKEVVLKRIENFDEDTSYGDDIVCPYCGCVYEDTYEWNDSGEYTCDDCVNNFSYSKDISISYSTEKVAKKQDGEKK